MPNTLTRYSSNSTGLSSLSGGSSYGLSEYGGNFTKAFAMTNLHEQSRAMLAYNALETVGAMSAMEAYLCQVAPSGAHRYKLIADVYASVAARAIAEW